MGTSSRQGMYGRQEKFCDFKKKDAGRGGSICNFEGIKQVFLK